MKKIGIMVLLCFSMAFGVTNGAIPAYADVSYETSKYTFTYALMLE